MMTIQNWLKLAQQALVDCGIDTARLDTLVLLEDAWGENRAWLLAHDDQTLSNEQLGRLADQLERRIQHEPMAYIRGFQEFYGRKFAVDADVLVPRPESETIIALVKQYATQDSRLADIGTGSGALAITAALETGAVTAAVDIDEACLAVAEHNAVLHSAHIEFIHGDLLEGLKAFKPTILLANLPYVPTNYAINDAARHEPALALFGGDDGLDLYRRMFTQAADVTIDLALTEALPEQHEALAIIAQKSNFRLIETNDFIQVFKSLEPRQA